MRDFYSLPLERFSLLGLIVATCLALHAPAGEVRTWTDKTGKFKIEAEFIEILDGDARLKRADGKTISVPLTKLSKEDQTYLREQARSRAAPVNGGLSAAPSVQGPRGPLGRAQVPGLSGASFGRHAKQEYAVGDEVEVHTFPNNKWKRGKVVGVDDDGWEIFVTLDKEGTTDGYHDDEIRPVGVGPAALATPAGVVGGQQLAPADLSSVRLIVPLGGDVGEFSPDPGPSDPSRARALRLTPSQGFFQRVVSVSYGSPEIAAVACVGSQSMQDDRSTVEICDLAAGRSKGVFVGPNGLSLFALSPSGGFAATVSDIEPFDHGPLQVWRVTEEGLDHVASWFASTDDRHGKLLQVAFADEKTVMTLDPNNLLAWNLDGPRAVFQIPVESSPCFALSPGRRLLAVKTNLGVNIHDAASGDLISRVPIAGATTMTAIVWSPDGTQLALADSSYTKVVDLASKATLCEVLAKSRLMGPQAKMPETAVCWADKEHVLVGGSALVHVPSQTVVWNYQQRALDVQGVGGRCWYLFGDPADSQRALIPFTLPHDAVKPASDDQLAIAPGSQVCIELELAFLLNDAAGDFRSEVTKKLTTDLERSGFVVVDDAPARLIARLTPGKTGDVTYERWGIDRGSETVSVTEQLYELELNVNNQVVWARNSRQVSPRHLQLERGETIDQAVARSMLPSTVYFGPGIPARILSVEERERRVSQLSVRGLQ